MKYTYVKRLWIILLVTFLKLESAVVVPTDITPDFPREFRRVGYFSERGAGYLSALSAVVCETSGRVIRLVRSDKRKESSFRDDPPLYSLVSVSPRIIELPGIASWPREGKYDQSPWGTCTANAMAFCIRYLSIRNSRDPSNFLTNPERLDPSRFYIYYHSRLLGASPSQPAAGATLSDTVLAVEKYGCCSESRWGYDIKRSAQQPSPECYREALDPSACEYKACSGANRNPYAYVFKHLQPTDILSKHKGFSWVSSSPGRELVNEFCRSLLNNTPILYAFALDKSYDHHIVGFVPMPDVATFKATSGHAVAIVGYGNYNASEPGAKYFKFINSAGPSWGHSGYGYLPEEYVTRTGLLSLEGYAINMPRVTTTVTVSRAVCTPARSRPITYGPRRAH